MKMNYDAVCILFIKINKYLMEKLFNMHIQ